MRRTKVYLSGPLTLGCRLSNLDQGLKAYRRLLLAGYTVFCPHFSSFMVWLLEDMSHRDWLDSDLPWVEASDAVLRLEGDSIGADLEVEHATKFGIPIYYSMDDLFEELSPTQPEEECCDVI